MLKSLLITYLLTLSTHAIDTNKLADAIYKAEGGSKTHHPYGILSVRTQDPRRVCLTTIANRLKVWDGKSDFITFLALKYCPPSSDPIGHRRWIANVHFFYDKAN